MDGVTSSGRINKNFDLAGTFHIEYSGAEYLVTDQVTEFTISRATTASGKHFSTFWMRVGDT